MSDELIADMLRAADNEITELRDQAERDASRSELERVQAENHSLIDAMRDEIDEGMRLRDLGGARPNEGITAMTERVIRERDQLRTMVDIARGAIRMLEKELCSQAQALHEQRDAAIKERDQMRDQLRSQVDQATKVSERRDELALEVVQLCEHLAGATSTGWISGVKREAHEVFETGAPTTSAQVGEAIEYVCALARVRFEKLAALPTGDAPAEPEWDEPTTVAQRMSDAVTLLCAGARPPYDMVCGWLGLDKESGDDRLQEFAIEHGPAWAQGIGLLDAAWVMVSQPTEGVEHEYARTEPAAAQPLTDEQITALRTAIHLDADDYPEAWAYACGVRDAERAHGINPTKEQDA